MSKANSFCLDRCVTIESDLEREAWLKLSEDNLSKTWNNADDDAFNELLKK